MSHQEEWVKQEWLNGPNFCFHREVRSMAWSLEIQAQHWAGEGERQEMVRARAYQEIFRIRQMCSRRGIGIGIGLPLDSL